MEKLKVSQVREWNLLEGGWVCNKCYCQALKMKGICQFPCCTSSNLSPAYIWTVCTSCFTRNVMGDSSKKKPVKRTKKVHLYSILKPEKPSPSAVEHDHQCGINFSSSVDQSVQATETECLALMVPVKSKTTRSLHPNRWHRQTVQQGGNLERPPFDVQ